MCLSNILYIQIPYANCPLRIQWIVFIFYPEAPVVRFKTTAMYLLPLCRHTITYIHKFLYLLFPIQIDFLRTCASFLNTFTSFYGGRISISWLFCVQVQLHKAADKLKKVLTCLSLPFLRMRFTKSTNKTFGAFFFYYDYKQVLSKFLYKV